jgi:type IV pilus assembly protein PilB
MAERIRLGDLLVDMGLITRSQLEEALLRQKEDKRRLGELLVAAGAITEAKVTQVISQQLSVPWVSLSHIDFSRPLLDLVPTETAQKYGVVPIYVRRGKNREQTLYVAMQDPTEADALEEIAGFSGLPVRAMIAPPSDIRGAIRAYYLGLPPEEEPLLGQSPVPPSDITAADLRSLPPSAPGVVTPVPAAPAPPRRAPSAPAKLQADDEEAPDSSPVESRAAAMPRPKQAGRHKMVTLTLLDGTQITLPASPKTRGDSTPAPSDLTARDLIEALRAQAGGADASEVAALLSLLLKKHLISDWEFVRELKR